MDWASVATILVALITSVASIVNTIISKKTNKKVDCIETVKHELKLDIKNMNDRHREEMDKHILEADKTFLVNFLSDIEQQIPKTDIQIQRAYEVYEEYRKKNGNSYVHDKWEYCKENKLI